MAFRLRSAGLSWVAIARQVGCTKLCGLPRNLSDFSWGPACRPRSSGVGRELVQRCRGEAYPKGCEGLTQDTVDLDGGLSLLGSGQRTKDGAGVAASLLLDLGGHAAVG